MGEKRTGDGVKKMLELIIQTSLFEFRKEIRNHRYIINIDLIWMV